MTTRSHWVLWRQDDNGNTAVVATFTSRRGAEQAHATYEARGHKQLYWIEENRCAQPETEN